MGRTWTTVVAEEEEEEEEEEKVLLKTHGTLSCKKTHTGIGICVYIPSQLADG